MTLQTWAIQRMLSWKAGDRGAECACVAGGVGGAAVTLTPWAPNAVRCRITAGTLPAAGGFSYLADAPDPAVRADVTERPGGIALVLERLTVEVGRDPWSLMFRNADGGVLTRQVADDLDLRGNYLGPPPGFEVEGAGRAPARRIARTFETLLLRPEDHWYGLGEKFMPLDKLGRTVTTWQSNAAGARSELAYKNIPFVMTPRGYGIFVNTTSEVKFWLGSRSNRTWTIDVPGGDLEYVFIAGTLEEILRTYAGLTGMPAVPPRWSFGLWTSTCFAPTSDASVRRRAARLREERIPADVIHLDCYWQAPMQWSDLTWDPETFPDPATMIADLHADGYKVCLWENPYVSVHSRRFREGAEHGYFLRQPDGTVYTAQLWAGAGGDPRALCAIVDFTNPAAAAWFRRLHDPLLAMGVDTFKTDFGEEIPPDAVFHNGRTGAEMRNLYARLYQELVFTMLRERRGRAVIWARSASPGVQRFPAHWSGDPHCTYEDMAATLRGGLSAGMSGLAFWSHDLGGFKGTPSPDLYVRWIQWGLLSTHARYHGTTLRDPWEFGEEATAIFRRYAELRYRLLPYLYTYAIRAAETGLPVMRPLVLRHQDDPATYGIDLEYLLGDELLVAPVFDDAGKVTVYLPRGRWTDFWTGEVQRGPTTLRMTAPLDVLPVFVRENSLLPLGPVMQYVDERATDPLTIEAYVTTTAAFALRADEGTTDLRVSRRRGAVVFDASSASPTYVVRVHGAAAAESAAAGGAALARTETEEDLAARPSGWTVTPEAVVVKARARRIELAGCAFSDGFGDAS